MLLLSVSRSTDKFSRGDMLGLRSLLLSDATTAGAPPAAGGVVVRTIAAPRRDAGRVHVQAEEAGRREKDRIDDEEEEDDEGCWVSYGCRGAPRRRLPPPIPSLRSAMRRGRTEDGRIVITEAAAGARRPEQIRAQRHGGRLTMQLVERKDFYPLPSPALDLSSSPAQDEADDDIAAVEVVNDMITTVDVGECGVHCRAEKAPAPAVPPPLRTMGCFEDVVKYHSIGRSSMHQMPRLRMVH